MTCQWCGKPDCKTPQDARDVVFRRKPVDWDAVAKQWTKLGPFRLDPIVPNGDER